MSTVEHIKVLSILETLKHIEQFNASVARFGDGEIDLICGHSIPYQDYDIRLAGALKMLLEKPSSPELMICLPDVFTGLERYTTSARSFWQNHFEQYGHFYVETCRSDWYGSTFISRPYIDLADKSLSETYFKAIRQIWDTKDILIVEGLTSRSGVGNDLFANASSVQRIICPSRNAFTFYDEILKTIKKYAADKLVLLMLGPTAKLLANELSSMGIQAIDIGHIDSEYEWYQMGTLNKVKLAHKHTAEFNYDDDIYLQEDSDYSHQIIASVGVDNLNEGDLPTATNHKGLVSLIVPVYNVKPYLPRCLNSILKQTYAHFEVILVNDGSTDGSGLICDEYALKDARIRVIHQENVGVSAARNRAIDVAQGEYISFIDSDDFIDEGYLELLYNGAQRTGADVIVTNFTSFNEERQSFLFYQTNDTYFEKTYSIQEWIDEEANMKYNLHLVFTFSHLKLFKRELFGSIRYPVGRLREDDATIYKLYLKANRIHFINQGSYYYSQRSDGLSRNGMLSDIAGMISNAEERLALLVALGYNTESQMRSYIHRLRKCQVDAMQSGQINLYNEITAKIELYEHFGRI